MLLDGEEWATYFENFKRSAWRLETQPTYTMPNEADLFVRFLAGEPKPDGFNFEWEARVRNNVTSGKAMGRVRVVRRPFSNYTLSQFSRSIPGNISAGEDIRILDLTNKDVELPNQDFWLFDESVVVHLNFRPDGTLQDRELVESPDLAKYLKWRDVAIVESVPFSEYVDRT